jgi:hypothetical protein
LRLNGVHRMAHWLTACLLVSRLLLIPCPPISTCAMEGVQYVVHFEVQLPISKKPYYNILRPNIIFPLASNQQHK